MTLIFYQDEDVIGELEKQLSELKLDDVKKSPLQDALETGKTVVEGQPRKVISGDRKTKAGKEAAKDAEQ